MRFGRCIVVGAGDVTARGLVPLPGDVLIAADGGLDALNKLGLRPACVVGDLDSLAHNPRGIPLLRFPVRKDDTDLALAIRLGVQLHFDRFVLYGATGGTREDHFLAALQLMGGMSADGHQMSLIAPGFSVHALHNGRAVYNCKPGATVSVFSHSRRSYGVSLQGLSFAATNLRLTHDRPLGVSNQALHNRFVVGVDEGVLLIYIDETPVPLI